jgi:hypothetical protein
VTHRPKHSCEILTFSETEMVLSIPISFADAKLDEFDMYRSAGGLDSYFQCVVSLYLTWRDGSVRAKVVWGEKVLYNSDD